MTETKENYLTKTKAENRIHSCPNCQHVFGVEADNGHLIVGDLVLSILRGKCAVCGGTIKWYSTDYRMERLIRGRKK